MQRRQFLSLSTATPMLLGLGLSGGCPLCRSLFHSVHSSRCSACGNAAHAGICSLLEGDRHVQA